MVLSFLGYRTHYVTSLVYLTGLFKKMAEHKALFTKVMCNCGNISNTMNAIFLEDLGCLWL